MHNQVTKENADLKHDLKDKIKTIELLTVEIEIVRKERNDNILQVHNFVKETQKPRVRKNLLKRKNILK